MNRRLLSILASVVILVGASFGATEVFAQGQLGLEQAAGVTGLGEGNLTLMIARIIRAFFGLLGILAVVLVAYGGFVWMTAGGDDEKVGQAKKIIMNGTIGLMIILLSFGIASFAINAIVGGVNGTGLGGAGNSSGQGGAGGGGLPGGGYGSVLVARMPSSTKVGFIPEFNIYFYKGLGEPAAPKLSTVILGQTLFITQNDKEVPVDIVTEGNMVRLQAKDRCATNKKKILNCFANDAEFVITVKDGFAGITTEDGLSLSCDAANPCTVKVKTGSIDDNTPPNANVLYLQQQGGANAQFGNGSIVPIESSFIGHANAKDDNEIKHVKLMKNDVLYGFYQAKQQTDGYYPQGLELTFAWDTRGLKLFENETIKISGEDTAGNVGTPQSFAYGTQGAMCSDGVQNSASTKPPGDETGVDCGGTSCLACKGSSCTADSQCASGKCDPTSKQCVEDPVIYGVYGNEGAPGTVVTIVGKGFGSTKSGSAGVTFGVGKREVAGAVATCGSIVSWSNNQIVTIVPKDSSTGPLKVMNSVGKFDVTNGGSGPTLPDFTINNILKPGILCVTPTEGFFGSTLTITGLNFGATQTANAHIALGDVLIAPKQWADTRVISTIPQVAVGAHSVSVTVDDVQSNPFTVTVKESTGNTKPTVTSISPATATPGSTVVITGNGFGAQKGSVFFGDVPGDFTFPAQCGTDQWDDNRVVVKVPPGVSGSVRVAVERVAPIARSGTVSLVVTSGNPLPSVCDVTPDNGPIGTNVTVNGEGFGSTGVLSIESSAFSNVGWGQTSLTGQIPSGAKSGPIAVKVGEVSSNGFPFLVRDCSVGGCADNGICCATGTSKGSCVPAGSQCPGGAGGKPAAKFEWLFSTGDIPLVPTLVYQCSVDTVPSPAPWSGRNGGGEACNNAKITGVLSTNVKLFSYGKEMVVELCGADSTDTCTNPTLVAGTLVQGSANGAGFEFAPSALLASNRQYRVTLSTNIVAEKTSGSGAAIHMVKDTNCAKPAGLTGEPSACFTFKTRVSTDICAVSAVFIDPETVVANSLGNVMQPKDPTKRLVITASGKGADRCVLLNTNNGAWSFSTVSDPNPPSVYLDTTGQSHTRMVKANMEQPANSKGYQYAAEFKNNETSKVKAPGFVKVSLAKPEIVSYTPNCNNVCSNSDIQLVFNVPMNAASFVNNVAIAECNEESCVSYARWLGGKNPLAGTGQQANTIVLEFSESLKPGKYYRVIVAGGLAGIRSASGGSLNNPNFNGQFFTWKFRTRTAGDECVVKSVSMMPIEGRVNKIGGEVEYRAIPRAVADACDPRGQSLSATNYHWNWSTVETLVAEVTNRDVGSNPSYCSTSCISQGSSALGAVCGDNVVTAPFEACEGGAGCTARCVKAGSTQVKVGGTCGNGVVDAAEECDDKNEKTGDGCSLTCLFEGGTSGTQCGNGDLGAGEACDDGNQNSGDGCSAQCKREGSPVYKPKCSELTSASLAALKTECDGAVFAVCGNKVLENGETCDVGPTCVNGTACTSAQDCRGMSEDKACKVRTSATCTDRCLNPAYIPTTISPSCGNGVIEPLLGEQCDPKVDGDGRIDPIQTVVALGRGTVVEGEQIAHIKAEVTRDSSNKPQNAAGAADFVLQCGYTHQSECESLGAEYGLATNTCCALRPKVAATYPVDDSRNICTNTSIWVDATTKLDQASLTGNVGLFVRTSVSAQDDCPGNLGKPIKIVTNEDSRGTLFDVMMSSVRSIAHAVFGTPVHAEFFACPATVTGSLRAVTDDTHTRIIFTPSALLEKNKPYYFAIEGGSEGVRSSEGVPFADGWNALYFTTGGELCQLDRIELNDDAYLFTENTEDHQFIASARTSTDAEIASISGVYSWKWKWSATQETPAGLFQYGDDPKTAAPTSETDNQNVAANNIQGTGTLNVLATIVDDAGTKTKDQTKNATAQLTAAFCEQPWPALDNNDGVFEDREGATYSSEFGSAFSITGNATNPLTTNFAFRYCRDAGVPQFTSDDLPGLMPIVIGNPPDTATTLKEFFFTPVNNQGAKINKDVIGIRVEKNSSHLPIGMWYKMRGFTGNPTPLVIDGFPALQDGRTVYISAIHAANATDGSVSELRTNVYVISYNQNADTSTVTIFNQLLKNLKLVINVQDSGLCYVEKSSSGIELGQYNESRRDVIGVDPVVSCTNDSQCGSGQRCDALSIKARRDLQRLADVGTIEAALQTHMTHKGTYPVLPSGTYIPGRAVSTWGSWQSAFGNALSTSVPVDPLNKLGACTDPKADKNTCWNVESGTYACPAGSHVYEYVAIDGARDYQIRTDFELSTLLWKNNNVTNARLISQSACTTQVVGAASTAQCGNSILETGEECDPKGSKIVEQTSVNGVAVGVTYTCDAQCKKADPQVGALVTCGNATLDAGETCDSGDKNGQYGYCNSTCSTTLMCGDGVIQNINSTPKGPEVCELGRCATGNSACTTNKNCIFTNFTGNARLVEGCALANTSDAIALFAPLYGFDPANVNSLYDCGICEIKSGTRYSPIKEQSCNWDCRSFGPYCGDGIRNGQEACDVGAQGGKVTESCVLATGVSGTVSGTCTSACAWATGKNINQGVCEPLPTVVGAGTATVNEGCGDANPDPGESCDLGSNNGVKCAPGYNSSCPYCTAADPANFIAGCTTATITGGRCGDTIKNGPEKCDAKDFGSPTAAQTYCESFGFDGGVPSCATQCMGVTQAGCGNCTLTGAATAFNVSASIRNGLSTAAGGFMGALVFPTHNGSTPKGGTAIYTETDGKATLKSSKVMNAQNQDICTTYELEFKAINNQSDYTFEKTPLFGTVLGQQFNAYLFEKSKLPGNTKALVVGWDNKSADVDILVHRLGTSLEPVQSLHKGPTAKTMTYENQTIMTHDRQATGLGGYETVRFYERTTNGNKRFLESQIYLVQVKFTPGFTNKSSIEAKLYDKSGVRNTKTITGPAFIGTHSGIPEAFKPASADSVYFYVGSDANGNTIDFL